MADRIPSASSSRRSKAGDNAIGQFIIGAEIGKGSFAQVYSGKHQVRTQQYPCLQLLPVAISRRPSELAMAAACSSQ